MKLYKATLESSGIRKEYYITGRSFSEVDKWFITSTMSCYYILKNIEYVDTVEQAEATQDEKSNMGNHPASGETRSVGGKKKKAHRDVGQIGLTEFFGH
jgi:hypothetical protein